ncbi:MAG: acylphosphatase [Deltaproteobacteria bacterium]|jgi:acylphosphatase|nr:acylphosphatase [Deltaproteobacteria bacterium]
MEGIMERLELLIEGKVQGVFYRASTLEHAQSLNLVGMVENLPEGMVEVIAEGPRESLEQLLKWCEHGPPAAEVKHVAPRWKEPTGEFQTFSVKR